MMRPTENCGHTSLHQAEIEHAIPVFDCPEATPETATRFMQFKLRICTINVTLANNYVVSNRRSHIMMLN
jgi:hypothetical protein